MVQGEWSGLLIQQIARQETMTTYSSTLRPHGGYRKLRSFQVTEIVYDGTVSHHAAQQCSYNLQPGSMTIIITLLTILFTAWLDVS